jgi:hypothetical protein
MKPGNRGRSVLQPIVIVAALLGIAAAAKAEPYLAVFKGMQCSACHSHPAGGGLRTTYGSVYAQSEMPAERVGDTNAEFWTGEVLSWLSVGGDLRAEYRYVDTPNSESTSEFDVVRGAVYLEAKIVPNRLSLYVDQQVAPGSSLNREAYVRLTSKTRKFFVTAGQFFLPYGLRLQDDSAFVRQTTGINFTIPDRGAQFGYESGAWSTQLSVTNGSGGGSEFDQGKQLGFIANYVRPLWRAGISLNVNDTDFGDRQMQNVFVGVKTGPIAWLAEADLISDQLPNGSEQDAIASFVEANWLVRRGHNIKISYGYFDPNDDIDEDHQVRYSLVWEYTPMQFLQGRFGGRVYDGIPQDDLQNRDEFFAEIHGFF